MSSDDALKGVIGTVALLGVTKIVTDAAFKKPRGKQMKKKKSKKSITWSQERKNRLLWNERYL